MIVGKGLTASELMEELKLIPPETKIYTPHQTGLQPIMLVEEFDGQEDRIVVRAAVLRESYTQKDI